MKKPRGCATAKPELDDEIYGQEQKLGGLKQARLDLLKSREEAEERVKDLKLLTSRLDKEVDHLKGELHKRKPVPLVWRAGGAQRRFFARQSHAAKRADAKEQSPRRLPT